VAITILLLAIVGPLQIAAQALFSAYYSRDEITAYNLAEESIEYVKNARDTTFLDDVFDSDGSVPSSHWLNGLSDKCVVGTDVSGCQIDGTESFLQGKNPNSDAIKSCPSSGCDPLLFDLNSGIWTYDTTHYPQALPSKFTRTVVIIPQPNNGIANEEALIEVTVAWQGAGFGGIDKKVVVKAMIANWERK
jgi:hypothetical protein